MPKSSTGTVCPGSPAGTCGRHPFLHLCPLGATQGGSRLGCGNRRDGAGVRANLLGSRPDASVAFEDREIVVISNSMLMDDAAWRETVIYKEFYRPQGHFHNCDMFLKQNGRIAAVLSLVRKRAQDPFTAQEVELLARLQHFIEYALGKSFVSERVHNRTSLSAEYGLTAREMDGRGNLP